MFKDKREEEYHKRKMYESEKGLQQLRTGYTDNPLASSAGGGWGYKEPPPGWKASVELKKTK